MEKRDEFFYYLLVANIVLMVIVAYLCLELLRWCTLDRDTYICNVYNKLSGKQKNEAAGLHYY